MKQDKQTLFQHSINVLKLHLNFVCKPSQDSINTYTFLSRHIIKADKIQKLHVSFLTL